MHYHAQLDRLNFFLADVRGGLGPYVGVFLLTQAHWDQATIGAVLTVSGLIGIALHVPVGALIDATRFKRGLLVAGVAALTASALAIAWAPTLPVVLAADIVMAVLGAVFAPTVAAITLGLVGRAGLAERLGRNAACDRAGNIFIGPSLVWSAGRSGSAPCFTSCRSLRSSRPSPCWRSRPAPSITSRRAASTRTAPAVAGDPPDGTCCSTAGRSWCSLRALLCFTSPTRPCCRC